MNITVVKELNRRYNADPTPENATKLADAQRAYARWSRQRRTEQRRRHQVALAEQLRSTIRERLARTHDHGDATLSLVSGKTAEYLMMAPAVAGGFIAVDLDLDDVPSALASLPPKRREQVAFGGWGGTRLADLAGIDAPVIGRVSRAAVAADLRSALSRRLDWEDWVLVEHGDADYLLSHLDLVERP